jgi:carbon monoxide dehydrogenase subunit G
MPVVENSVTIDVPVETVFDFLDDPANYSKWFQGIRDAVGIKRTGDHIGDSWTIKYAVLGITMDIDNKVTEWEKNARFVISMGGMMPGSMTTTLSGDADSTKMTQRFDYEVKGGAVGKAMNSMVLERMNAKNAARSLQDLKDLLESDSA